MSDSIKKLTCYVFVIGVNMKKKLFYILFFLSPLIPITFYYVSIGAIYDSYTLSIILGVYAYVLVCNQFYLASQPAWLISLLGAKSVRSLHSTSPLFMLLLILFHFIIKLFFGFTITTIQAILGLIAFTLLFLGIFFALFLFVNTIVTKREKFSKLRTTLYAKSGLTYQKVRSLHSFLVVAGLLILIHAILASTSTFSYNPWGVGILILWMFFTLFSYLRYRLTGRNKKGKL